jgi:hypothetical protein
MPDLTAQPAGDNGVNPLFSSAVFLWNAAVPGKNQVNGNTTTPKGTNTTGSAGKFQLMSNTDGAFSFPITKPASAYTLVAVLCHPTASVGFTKTVSIPGGNFRLETQTTGGGVYQSLVHTGSAAAASTFVSSVGAFNTAPWTYVAAYSAGTLRQYLKRGDGTTAATTTESIGYSNSGTAQIDIGETLGQAGQGVYAVMLVPSDVGDAECQALRDNPWRMFNGGTALTWTGAVPAQTSTVGAAISALSVSSYVSGGAAPYTYGAGGLPPGLNINASTGSITGTPTTVGSYAVTVTATDSTSASVSSAAFGWTVSAAAATSTLTVSNIRNSSGGLLANTTLPNVVVVQRSNRAALLTLTAQVTNGAGALVITNGALSAGTACVVLAFSDDGTSTGAWPAVVA